MTTSICRLITDGSTKLTSHRDCSTSGGKILTSRTAPLSEQMSQPACSFPVYSEHGGNTSRSQGFWLWNETLKRVFQGLQASTLSISLNVNPTRVDVVSVTTHNWRVGPRLINKCSVYKWLDLRLFRLFPQRCQNVRVQLWCYSSWHP